MPDPVSRIEFEELKDVVDTINKNVSTLIATQAKYSGKQGTIQMNNVWQGLAAMATVCVIVSALILFAIRADIAPIVQQMESMEDANTRLRSLESQARVANIRDMWMADIVNLERDWRNRTSQIPVRPPGYTPMKQLLRRLDGKDL